MKTPYLGPVSPETFNFRGLQQYLFYGDKGNGKSLLMTYLADYLFFEYARTWKKYGTKVKPRALFSSMKFNKIVEDKHLGKDLYYWSSPKQLYDLRNVDIIWDEIGKDLPASSWADTPKDLRQVFSHLRKRGNRLFANTQIYNDIDISFRRQVDHTYRMYKFCGSPDISASLPPVKYIWGLILLFEMDKNSLENESDETKQKLRYKWALPRALFIEKQLIDMYDTTMEIPAFRPTDLQHIEYKCPQCGKVHIKHETY